MKSASVIRVLIAMTSAAVLPSPAWGQAIDIRTNDDSTSTSRFTIATTASGAPAVMTVLASRLQFGSGGYFNVASAAAGTLSEGDLRYDTGTNVLQIRVDAAWETVVTGGNSAYIQSSSTFDESGAQTSWFNIKNAAPSRIWSTDTTDGDMALVVQNQTGGGAANATRTGIYGAVSGGGTTTTNMGIQGEASNGTTSNIGVMGMTSGAAGSSMGMRAMSSATTASSSHYGIYADAMGSANSSSKYGVYGSATGAGTGSTTNYGIYGTASGATANYAGFFTLGSVAVTTTQRTVWVENLNTNTTTDGVNKVGLYITSTGSFTGSTGTATNNYGLYVDTVSGADNNYGAYFAQNVGIGTTSPSAGLHVLAATLPQGRVEWTTNTSYGQWDFYESGSKIGGVQVIGTLFGTTDRRSDLELLADNDIGLFPGNALQVTFKSGGSVGIGRSDPQALLHIQSATTPQGRIEWTTSSSYGQLMFYESGNYIGAIQGIGTTYGTAERQQDMEIVSNSADISFWPNSAQAVTIKSGGNVGIGDTTPEGRLDVDPSGAVTTASYALKIDNTATSSTASINKYGAYITSTGTWNGGSAKNYGLYVDTVSGGTNNYSAAFMSGNVGIGTAAPTGLLHATGGNGTLLFDTTNPSFEVQVSGATGTVSRGLLLSQHNTGAQAALFNFRKSRGTSASPTAIANGDFIGLFFAQPYDGGAYIMPAGFGFKVNGTVSSGSVPTDLILSVGSTDAGSLQNERMRITSAGSVGIGTASPTYILSLGGDAARTVWMERHTTSNTAGNSLTVQAGGATSGATDKSGGDFYLSSGIATGNGGSIVYIQSVAASQGAGTADRNPATRLTISGSSVTSTLPVLLPNGSLSAPALAFSGDPNTGIYSSGTADTLSLVTAGAEQVRIQADGTVSIGTTSDSAYKLDVQGGNLRTSGTVTAEATSNQLVLGTTNTVTLHSPAPAASRTYTIPDVLGPAQFVMDRSSRKIRMEFVALQSADGILWTHPGGYIELQYAHATNTLDIDKKGNTQWWEIGLQCVKSDGTTSQDATADNTNDDDAIGSGELLISGSGFQTMWYAAGSEEGGGPGFVFYGTGKDEGTWGRIQGLVIYWD